LEGGVAEDKISVIYDGVPLRDPVPGGDRLLALSSDDPLKATDLARESAERAGVPLHLSTHLEADLAGAGLFLYLTHSEGLGSAVLIAMAAGVPVIASRIGGLPEIIRHRENGWLSENDPEPLAAAIHELLTDRVLAHRLAVCGRQTVAEKFSLDQMIDNTLRLYRQVLCC
jgi:glycosyltransferase involved in cell wall biosynthesis